MKDGGGGYERWGRGVRKMGGGGMKDGGGRYERWGRGV